MKGGNGSNEVAVIAIDLGGTWIKSGLVYPDGRVAAERRRATPKDGREAVLSALAEDIETLSAQASAPPAAVGLGSPGMVDDRGYLHRAAVNIPGWNDFDLAATLGEQIRLPVVALNDANAAAMAEVYHGAGRGASTLALITVGTGIGGGLVVDGRPYAGRSGAAGELGHMVLRPRGRRCACGNLGCAEAYASAAAVDSLAREWAKDHHDRASELAASIRRGVHEQIGFELIYNHVARGDQLALMLHDTLCDVLAQLAAAVATTIAPERILFSGGVMQSADLIIPEVTKRFSAFVLAHIRDHVTISTAGLARNAGIIGAGAAAFAVLGETPTPVAELTGE
ncbi:MAG: ROK family protein [Spirochaetales bacterium]